MKLYVAATVNDKLIGLAANYPVNPPRTGEHVMVGTVRLTVTDVLHTVPFTQGPEVFTDPVDLDDAGLAELYAAGFKETS